MSEIDFKNGIRSINKGHSIALIETEKIMFLVKTNGSYKMMPVNIEGLLYIPVIINAKEAEKAGEIAYNLSYKLLIPHINLPSTYNEEYKLDENSQIICTHTINDTTEESPVIYDNKDDRTILKLKRPETLENYLIRNKRKLFELKHLIDGSIELANELNRQKTLKL